MTCATIPTALTFARGGYRPGLVMVDEAHHVAEDGQLAELLDLLGEAAQFGVTATPWRGDQFDIRHRFGEPSYTLGIEDGMRLGYLADVRYRLFLDNIDWEFVPKVSEHSYTMKDLNARLFLPERDEAIRDQLIAAWRTTARQGPWCSAARSSTPNGWPSCSARFRSGRAPRASMLSSNAASGNCG